MSTARERYQNAVAANTYGGRLHMDPRKAIDLADAAINELLAKLAAAEERVERLKALVSYLDDADDHNGLLIMQFEDAEEDAQ